MKKTYPTTLAVFAIESALPDSLKSELEYVSHCQVNVGEKSILYWIPPALSESRKLIKPATIKRFQHFIDQLEFRLSEKEFSFYVLRIARLQEDQEKQTPEFYNLQSSNLPTRPRFIQELAAFNTIITKEP